MSAGTLLCPDSRDPDDSRAVLLLVVNLCLTSAELQFLPRILVQILTLSFWV